MAELPAFDSASRVPASVVCLVIEPMTAGQLRRLHVVLDLLIRVSECSAPKRCVKPREERLNPRVFPHPCALQSGKIIVQNVIDLAAASLVRPSRRNSSIAERDVIQSVNAEERSHARPAVLRIVQLRAFRKQSLVRHAVVPRQHLKMVH